MIKVIELIIVATLLIFSFFAGVKYSDSVKNHASWLFEQKEEEVELPDLSNESIQEMSAPMDENGENHDDSGMPNSADGATATPQDLEPTNIDNTNPKPKAAAPAAR